MTRSFRPVWVRIGWARAWEAGLETQVGMFWWIPHAVEDRTEGRMHQRLQLGLRGKRKSWAHGRKRWRLQGHLTEAAHARERRETARKELKEILSLQPSLCSRLLCVFAVSWTFYVNKNEVLVKLWDPCIVFFEKAKHPKDVMIYTHASIHSPRKSVSRKECIWCPAERKDGLGKSKQERS